jgi:hypothetical protein
LRRGRDSNREESALCAEIVEIPASETRAIGVDATSNPPQPRSPVASADSSAVALCEAINALLRGGRSEEALRVVVVLATLLEGNATPHEPLALATVHPIIRRQSS